MGTVSLLKLIPGVNLLGMGAMVASAGAATFALGKVFTQHFDQGGTLLSFDPVKSRAYFEQVYEESKITVEELKDQEDSFKEADTQALASVATLKKANSELMATINNLEKQLKESKKERALAVAVAKTQTKIKKAIPSVSSNPKRRGIIGWLWRIGLGLVIVALILLALFQFNVIGNKNSKMEANEAAIISGSNNNTTQQNDIITSDGSIGLDTLSSDTTNINNSIDTTVTNPIDTNVTPLPSDSSTITQPPNNETSSAIPSQDTTISTLAN